MAWAVPLPGRQGQIGLLEADADGEVHVIRLEAVRLDADAEEERLYAPGIQAQAGTLIEMPVIGMDAGLAVEVIPFLKVESRAFVEYLLHGSCTEG